MTISETEEVAKKQLDSMSKTARKVGLRITYKKTKAMNTTRD